MITNFHTHSTFCDGKSSIEEMILSAIDNNVAQIGISSHAPLPFSTKWNLKDLNTLEEYLEVIKQYKSIYQNKIEIFAGLEADYIPKISTEFQVFRENFDLDYLIGSIHLVRIPESEDLWFIDGKEKNDIMQLNTVFGSSVQKAVIHYFKQLKEMVCTQKFDIIGHFDKIKHNPVNKYFDENEKWYKDEILSVLTLLREKGIIMEINTRSNYHCGRTDMFPSLWIIRIAAEMNIPIMINSDAHHVDEIVAGYDNAMQMVKTAGITKQVFLNNGQWEEIGLI